MEYTPKKGDRVRHKEYNHYGVGTVQNSEPKYPAGIAEYEVIYSRQGLWWTFIQNLIPEREDANELLKEIL